MQTTIARHSAPVKPGGPGSPRPSLTYSAVPHDILRDRRLIPTDIVVIGHLLAYARDKLACWPSVRTLSADCGKTRRTVQLSLARLKVAGWITERPADNPTGRILVLAWRDRGAQPAASPGRNQATAGGAQPVASESKKHQEEKVASPSGGGEKQGQKPAEPMSLEDRRILFAESGWLDRPPGDLLRQLAERRLLSGPTAAKAPASAVPGYAANHGRRRSLGGPGGGPRRLFGPSR